MDYEKMRFSETFSLRVKQNIFIKVDLWHRGIAYFLECPMTKRVSVEIKACTHFIVNQRQFDQCKIEIVR